MRNLNPGVDIWLEARALAEEILSSQEVHDYILAKDELNNKDDELKRLLHLFQRAKDDFDDAQRFGHFHPNFHEAKETAANCQRKLQDHPKVHAYVTAERNLNEMLYVISKILAESISSSIAVPNDDIVFV